MWLDPGACETARYLSYIFPSTNYKLGSQCKLCINWIVQNFTNQHLVQKTHAAIVTGDLN